MCVCVCVCVCVSVWETYRQTGRQTDRHTYLYILNKLNKEIKNPKTNPNPPTTNNYKSEVNKCFLNYQLDYVSFWCRCTKCMFFLVNLPHISPSQYFLQSHVQVWYRRMPPRPQCMSQISGEKTQHKKQQLKFVTKAKTQIWNLFVHYYSLLIIKCFNVYKIGTSHS